MQIIRVGYGIRGFGRITSYAIRWTRMVTEKAKEKARILAFWGIHGLNATTDAFKVSRRTLYIWKAQQQKGRGSFEALNEQSKRPKNVRVRDWSQTIKDEIKRLRNEHPNLGKDKVQILLKPFCAARGLACPSVSTVGNLRLT